ncbi:MAG: YkgJ family cysteine cluster protein [Sulfolobales archaeon]|nr:YkgJ family cysteine cluster protein [Sulfolobales archaeon]
MNLGNVAKELSFIDFGDICKNCEANCCRRFYAVLLPEEELLFKESSFTVSTPLGAVKAIGSRNGKPCPYLSEDNLCKIYSMRPFDCRIWPVIMYYDLKTGDKVIYLDLQCPAVIKNTLSKEVVDKVIEVLKKINVDEEWLKKYTLAPWPNTLKEITRINSPQNS